MIVGCLVLPDIDGSLCVYQHLDHPCLSMDPRIITCQFKRLKELFYKKDDFLVEVERYVKEYGTDALENLITSKKRSAEPNVAVNEIKAVAVEDRVRQIQPIIGQTENRTFLPLENINKAAPIIGSRDLHEILPPKKVQKIWTCAICQVTAQSETVLNSHLQGNRHKSACEQLKVKNRKPKGEVSSASVGKKSNVTIETERIGVRDHTGISSPQNGQKAWTCVKCQSTLKSQIDINSHLQGKQHQKACALLNSKNQASNCWKS